MSTNMDLTTASDWRKSQRSMANGNCVEVGRTANAVAVRDSMNATGDTLAYSAATWRAFTAAARTGHFDAL